MHFGREDNNMNKVTNYLIFIIAGMLLLSGCSGPDQYEWIPWYKFRGYCYLKLNLRVDSQPADAKVFINGVYEGTTPYSFVYESAPHIAGEKRKLTMPQDGSIQYQTRKTQFLGESDIEIMVVKQGYKPRKKTITIEDYFRSDSLDHEQTYAKSIKLTYHLKKQGWSIFRRGKVESDID
jgi:hypothetical protein